MYGLKSSRFETWTRYCFVPVLASQLMTRRLAPPLETGLVGSLIVCVYSAGSDHGPGVVPLDFGKSARIFHVKMPVPVIFSKEAAVDGKPEYVFGLVEFGSWTCSVYETAPSTGNQRSTGRLASPSVGVAGS